MNKNKLKGNLLLLVTAMGWGSGFAIRKLGTEMIPPMTFNALRELLGAVFLLPLLFVTLKKSGYLSRQGNSISTLEHRRRRAVKAGALCGILFTAASMAQSLGLATSTAGKSGFITSMYVVLTPFAARLFGTKIQKKSIVCIFLAAIGFALLSLKGGIGSIQRGDVLLLIGALFFALHIAVVGMVIDKGNGLLIAVIQMVFLGIVGLGVSIPIEHPTFNQFIQCIPALILCAFVTCTVANTAQIIGQQYTDATSAALILGLESVFSVVFGVVILGEMLSPREILGCLVIFGAVIYHQVDLRIIKRKKLFD